MQDKPDSNASILSHFPYSTFRPYQEKLILDTKDAFESGTKIVIIQAPTGSGKSCIAKTFLNHYETGYILTSQKILQDQYVNEFKDIASIKGRSNFSCNISGNSCSFGACIIGGLSKDPGCLVNRSCPYFKQLLDGIEADQTCLSYSSYLYNSSNMSKREILICDEAHNLEMELINYHTTRYSMELFKELGVLSEIPAPGGDIDAYHELLYSCLQGFLDLISEKDQSERVRYESIQKGMEQLESFLSDGEEFVVSHSTKSIEFKPLYPLSSGFLSVFPRVLMMSATILSPKIITDTLKLPPPVKYFEIPSSFPLKNRPIYYKGCGELNQRNVDKNFPAVVKYTEQILNKLSNQKGIIHCHSWNFSDRLKKGLSSTLRSRLLFQSDWDDKEKMLDTFYASKNKVLVVPAMHEGLDLKEELSRFQIILKVPYPYIGDPWMKIRGKDWAYYNWVTCLKLVQSYGRSIRSETDWAVTYILDGSFGGFYRRNLYRLPKWFKDAIKEV